MRIPTFAPRVGALIATTTMLAAIAGCGTDETQQNSNSPNADDPDLRYAQCMRDHGLNFPDPDPDGRIQVNLDTQSQAFRDADADCSHFTQGGQDDNSPDPEVVDALVRFAQCMRDHGIPFSDPGPDGHLNIQLGPGAPPPDQIQAAEAECRKYAPGPAAAESAK